MKIEMVEIEAIVPYERNAKSHDKKQVQQVAKSIKEFGWAQPLVVDKNKQLIIGHCRLEAAKQLELEEVPVLYMENLNEDQVKALRLADNKLNESPWDLGLVIDELKALDLTGYDINVTGFSTDLLLDDDAKDDFVPEVTNPTAKLGDIYDLDGHRLMCGDSTSREQVETLMNGQRANMVFTDPPYNVAYEGGGSYANHKTPKRKQILNDEMTKDNFYLFLAAVCRNLNEFCDGGVYICMSSSEIDALKRAYEAEGGHWQSFVIWVKNNFTLSRADYQHTYEPILYGWPTRIKNHYFIERRDLSNVWEDLQELKTTFDGEYTSIKFQGFEVRLKGKVEGEVKRKKQRTDIWRYDKPTKSTQHPTMKPVALCLEAIVNSSEVGGIVLDLFGGSGSTLIAAEKAERKCYMNELDPKFVDVIIKRWEEYTGKKAVLISGQSPEQG